MGLLIRQSAGERVSLRTDLPYLVFLCLLECRIRDYIRITEEDYLNLDIFILFFHIRTSLITSALTILSQISMDFRYFMFCIRSRSVRRWVPESVRGTQIGGGCPNTICII